MGILDAIAGIGKAIGGACALALQWVGLRNSPDMIARKKAQDEAAARDREAEAVRREKLEEIRNNVSP